MQKTKTGDFKPFDAGDWKLGIVVAQFNQQITNKLLASSIDRAQDYSLDPENILTIQVAGSVEIPLALQQLALTKRYDALLALGCIIRGDTPHFDYVCKFVTEGVLRVQLDHQLPIGFGILTCTEESQAEERVHLGSHFLDAVMHQAQAIRHISADH